MSLARAGGPRFRFFTGKGGVGKTTCAAGAAAHAAARGQAVLAVSTDPAHSLADALAVPLAARVRRVKSGRRSFGAVELDADRALARWLHGRRAALSTLVERGTYLDRDDIDRFLDLSLPGVDELIGLIELWRLARRRPLELVVVDTAPTGHTLRLLGMPATLRRVATVLDDMQAKHRFLSDSLGGSYRPDRYDRTIERIDGEAAAIQEALADPSRASFVWVLLPEMLSVEETADGIRALEREGMKVSALVVNRVTPVPRRACSPCARRIRAERAAIAALRRALPGRPLRFLPALAREPHGAPELAPIGRRLASSLHAGAAASSPPRERGLTNSVPLPAPTSRRPTRRLDWPATLAPAGTRLLCFGGKGGVGKTTCAATAALALAARSPRARILLLSTDPAHSLADVLKAPIGDDPVRVPATPPRLRARELDAARAFAAERTRYQEAVDRLFASIGKRSGFDVTYDRAVVRDLIDLAPPGLDEVFAVLSLVTALVSPARPAEAYDLVVLDTAPTGHALRLLEMPDAALQWAHALLAILLKYQQVIGLGRLAADLLDLSRGLRELKELLTDPRRTRFVVVTRAADLPRRETGRLVGALEKLSIAVPAAILNAITTGACERCHAARRREDREIAALKRGLGGKRGAFRAIILAPAVFPPPRGARDLTRFGQAWARGSAAAASGARR